MLGKLKKLKLEKSDQGFTIIEVMIVLAIAGLILLIVFLAVPALQRNARNTTLKNDASALAAGFQEYNSNNNGSNPASLAQSGASVTIGASGTSQAVAKVNAATTVTVAKSTPTTYTTNTLYWNTGTACDGSANSRAISVYYYIEVSGTGSNTPACVDG